MPITPLSTAAKQHQLETFVDYFVAEFMAEVRYLEDVARGNIPGRPGASVAMLFNVACALVSLIPVPGAVIAFVASQKLIAAVIELASHVRDVIEETPLMQTAQEAAHALQERYEWLHEVPDDVSVLHGRAARSTGLDDSQPVDVESLKVLVRWLGYQLARRYEQVLTERLSTQPELALMPLAQIGARRCLAYLAENKQVALDPKAHTEHMLAGIVLGHAPKWQERLLKPFHKNQALVGRHECIARDIKFRAEGLFAHGAWVETSDDGVVQCKTYADTKWLPERLGRLPKYGYVFGTISAIHLPLVVHSGPTPELAEWQARRLYQPITREQILAYVTSPEVELARTEKRTASVSLQQFLHRQSPHTFPADACVIFQGDLSGVDISCGDFSRVDFSGSVITGDFSYCNFSYAKLYATTLFRAVSASAALVNFSHAEMGFSMLANANFEGVVDFTQSDLTCADLTAARFGRVAALGARWYKAIVTDMKDDLILAAKEQELARIQREQEQQHAQLQEVSARIALWQPEVQGLLDQLVIHSETTDRSLSDAEEAIGHQREELLAVIAAQENRYKFEIDIRAKIEKLDAGADDFASQRAELEAQLERIQRACLDTDTELQIQRQQLDEVKQRMILWEQKVDALTARLNAQDEMPTGAGRSLTALEKAIAEQQKQLRELMLAQENRLKFEVIVTIKLRQLNASVAEEAAQRTELSAQLESLRTESAATDAELAQNIAALTARVDQLDGRVTVVEDDLAKLHTDLTDVHVALDATHLQVTHVEYVVAEIQAKFFAAEQSEADREAWKAQVRRRYHELFSAPHVSDRPSHRDYALMSRNVYRDAPDLLEDLVGWEVGEVFTARADFPIGTRFSGVRRIIKDLSAGGYFGVVYVHHDRKQIVLAHRGMELHNLGSLVTTFQGIVQNKIVEQAAWAHELTAHVLAEINTDTAASTQMPKYPGYRLSFTGHSLGAWLAELCVYHCHRLDDQYYPLASAVTFDSPGSEGNLKALQSNLRVERKKLKLENLDVTTYLSQPSLLNSLNPHIGSVYRVDVALPERSTLGAFLLYSLDAHNIDGFVAAFDEATGMPVPARHFTARDWPVLEADSALAFWKQLGGAVSTLHKTGGAGVGSWLSVLQSAASAIPLCFKVAKSLFSKEARCPALVGGIEYQTMWNYLDHEDHHPSTTLTFTEEYLLRYRAHYSAKPFDVTELPLLQVDPDVRELLRVIENQRTIHSTAEADFSLQHGVLKVIRPGLSALQFRALLMLFVATPEGRWLLEKMAEMTRAEETKIHAEINELQRVQRQYELERKQLEERLEHVAGGARKLDVRQLQSIGRLDKTITDHAAQIAELQYQLEMLSEAKSVTPSTLDGSLLLKLQNLRRRALTDEYMAAELELYIPVQGTRNIATTERFDMEGKAEEFLLSDKKVMLLLGGAGQGKSTFNRYLLKKLWMEFKPGGAIPIFISLPGLQNPEAGMLQEYFRSEAFTKEEIAALQASYSFVFILDGYDEMNSTPNLYVTNHLENWNAKVFIACRTQYLTQFVRYENYFAPIQSEHVLTGAFQEVSVVPFDEGQIDAYIAKYLTVNEGKIDAYFDEKDLPAEDKARTKALWKDPSIYRRHIDTIPGLRELVATPFLLMITLNVLPSIVEKHAGLEAGIRKKVTQSELYDEFSQQWFRRGEIQALANPLGVSVGWHDITAEFLKASEELAKEMYHADIIHVSYSTSEQKEGNFYDNYFHDYKIISTTSAELSEVSLEDHVLQLVYVQDSPLKKDEWRIVARNNAGGPTYHAKTGWLAVADLAHRWSVRDPNVAEHQEKSRALNYALGILNSHLPETLDDDMQGTVFHAIVLGLTHPWQAFFNLDNPRVRQILRGIPVAPVRVAGRQGYSFIHAELLTHFAVRAIKREELKLVGPARVRKPWERPAAQQAPSALVSRGLFAAPTVTTAVQAPAASVAVTAMPTTATATAVITQPRQEARAAPLAATTRDVAEPDSRKKGCTIS